MPCQYWISCLNRFIKTKDSKEPVRRNNSDLSHVITTKLYITWWGGCACFIPAGSCFLTSQLKKYLTFLFNWMHFECINFCHFQTLLLLQRRDFVQRRQTPRWCPEGAKWVTGRKRSLIGQISTWASPLLLLVLFRALPFGRCFLRTT